MSRKKTANENQTLPAKSEFLLYQTEDGQTRIEVRLENETVWLNQLTMAELFQTSKQNISFHLKNIFNDGELAEKRVVKEYLTTAGELISERADASELNMGLTSWKGTKVRKGDVTIAKNYLNVDEIEGLNRIVTMYLDYAEYQAKRHRQIFMRDWRKKLDAFLQFNERDILTNAGKVSNAVADQLAIEQYEIFHHHRLAEEAQRESLADDAELKRYLEKKK